MRRLKEEEIKKIIDMYKNGSLVHKIAEELGIVKSAVGYHLHKNGIKRRFSRRSVSEKIMNEIKKRHEEEEISIRKLSSEYGVQYKTVLNYLSYLNNFGNYSRENKTNKLSEKDIKKIYYLRDNENMPYSKIANKFDVSTNTVRHHCLNRKNKKYETSYNYDEGFFETIDSPEKAYILGLFYSDGYNTKCTNCVGIELEIADVELLEKVRSYFTNKPLYIRKKRDMAIFSMTNKTISKQLEDHGCVSPKSKIIRFPYFLERSLYRHFIRGFFDGDGGIYVYNNTRCANLVLDVGFFSSSIAFCNELKSVFEKEKINIKNIEHRKTCYALRIYGREALKLLDWIYENSTIHMDRKYKKYLQYKNQDWFVFRGTVREKDLLTLERMYVDGNSINKIAKHFGVCKATISRYLHKKNMVREREIKNTLPMASN